MLSLFSKSKIPVERQLDELGAIGLRLTEGVGVDDLFLYDSRGNMEKKPYSALITALGYCTEDGEDTPFCRSLWMCDYEGIEGYGDYVVLIRHLQVLSEDAQHYPTSKTTSKSEIIKPGSNSISMAAEFIGTLKLITIGLTHSYL